LIDHEFYQKLLNIKFQILIFLLIKIMKDLHQLKILYSVHLYTLELSLFLDEKLNLYFFVNNKFVFFLD